MEKFCAPTISYWKRAFFVAIAIAVFFPVTVAAQITVDTTISADTTSQQVLGANNVTITNDANINFTGSGAINILTFTGVTITNNAGASINALGSGNDQAIDASNSAVNNLTINNSGTISANDNQTIRVNNDSNFTLTNNVGGSITADRTAISISTGGGTITNSGTITTTGAGNAIRTATSIGLTITNNAGGVISSTGTSGVIRLDQNNTIINSGSIINSTSVDNNAIRLDGNNNTITLKDGGLVVGAITFDAGTTGNTLKLEQGFGQAYFYETSGTGSFTIEDLSGNTAVKGSAGSVGLGAQESVDELLGLRAFNLRSALKRYAAAPAIFKEDKLWAEPFSYYSKRGTNSSVLGYKNYGYGINFLYPLKQHKLDLIFTVEKSELEIDRNHDVSRTHLLAGVNATDFADLGDWKVCGFFVAGSSWHNGTREIFTNTTSTGKDNIVANFNSKEIITGAHVSNTFNHKSDQLKRNTWHTELGFTFGYSYIEDYDESQFFSFEERHLVQGSFHVGEQFTAKINDRLTLTAGGELEHRRVLAGREQTYKVSDTIVNYRHGSFYESSAAGNLGANVSLDNNTLAYLHLDSRFSDQTRGTYGASMGIQIQF
ncbi:MAG: hypothetical protein HOJ13_13380 [Nitrospina sp.]|nr:hypothetical protein [Nitrospina sp.]